MNFTLDVVYWWPNGFDSFKRHYFVLFYSSLVMWVSWNANNGNSFIFVEN